jgi:hypothetical protein
MTLHILVAAGRNRPPRRRCIQSCHLDSIRFLRRSFTLPPMAHTLGKLR